MSGIDLLIEIDKDEPEAAEICVEAFADGISYKFLLDTGSSKTILIHDESSAKYPPQGVHTLMGLFGKIDADLIRVPNFSWGPIQLENFEMARMSPDGPKRSQIGMDLMRGHCLHFDFSSNKVKVNSDGDSSLVFQNLLGTPKMPPMVKLQLQNKDQNCIWDTGAGITCVDFKVIESNPQNFTKLGSLGMQDTTEAETVEMSVYRISGLGLGTNIFADHNVVGADFSMISEKIGQRIDFVLGYNSLNKAQWFFDFPKNQWALVSE